MTIFTTIFPRTKLNDFIQRKEAKRAGCYILMGEDERTGETRLYIGEGEVVKERLRQHASGASQKEFWNEAIVFTSKDDYITKTQIQYLEAKLYELEMKKKQAEQDKRVEATSDVSFGNQIRTYTLMPYQLVKDERTGYQVRDADSVLDGDIQGFMIAYLQEYDKIA